MYCSTALQLFIGQEVDQLDEERTRVVSTRTPRLESPCRALGGGRAYLLLAVVV